MEILSCCLDGVTLYHPVGSIPSASLQPWIDKGFLDVRIPFAGIVSQGLVEAALTDWKTWGAMHPSADLAYFKEMGHKLVPIQPLTPQLTSEIKGAKDAPKDTPSDRDLAVQLFLLLAHDFDQQSSEIQQQLLEIDTRRRALEDFFRIDDPERGNRLAPDVVFARPEEDLGRVMTQTRMVAWNYLFQKAPSRSGILVTDSPAAVDFLLGNREDKREVLHVPVPCPHHVSEGLSLKAHVAPLFSDLLTKPWDEDRRRQVQRTGRELLAMVTPEKPDMQDSADAMPTCRWYLVPHVEAKDLLNNRCTTNHREAQKKIGSNVLVGLIDVTRPE
jgi:hypothetical protein